MKVAAILVTFVLFVKLTPAFALFLAGVLLGCGIGVSPDKYTEQQKTDFSFGLALSAAILLAMVLLSKGCGL